MQHDQRLTYEELRQAAYDTLDKSPFTQADMAEKLGVSRGSVASAVHTAGSRYKRLQIQILEHLTGYTISPEQEVRFRALRKERSTG
ncbi:transcriptional regulator with XRE-family HTH domain [Salinibacter ruber]|jgi:DNA-binding transcriptional regulator LsrR (DeoR family)|uniref:Transcriptional regulator with XRE-family HTH domain n=1 Tax=Salinibacter ruber TaxID=146919 RepID=A0A9X2UNY7_9BACT|nr:transcriptional regulator with XRE-family HTH domain [Salinibacter ruber]MCS4038077.1 transcriptional regulator with XRE-family HTH domain [Salinibacter ruber]